MKTQVITDTKSIFEQGNLHMKDKLRHFGGQGSTVIKYIISKLRKYHGEFFESNKTIAEACSCSVRTVQNAIKRAEQLEIFIVSSRSEETFSGKMRQTSNKIQLLAYESVVVVKNIVETVRTVASKVAKKVKTVTKKSNITHEPKAPVLSNEALIHNGCNGIFEGYSSAPTAKECMLDIFKKVVFEE